jgi:NAD(P)-dependent dehydrogenase (short-subunit alcohol dehydrogenase family)
MLAAAGLGIGLVARELAMRRGAIDLAGRAVLITGGSRGLGLAMAQEFARQGAHLAICARDDDTLERARAELVRAGAEVLAIPCDVAVQDQVGRMVESVTSHYGRIDVLVNNAGVIQVGPLQDQTIDDFRQAMDVMFWGTVYCTLAVLPQMRQRHTGRIVNITSIGGKVPVPLLMPYNSAKHAAVGFSETLRAEVARDGVTVTTVVPGLMRTGSYKHAMFKGQNEVEYSLFSPLSSLPLTSIDARKAAREIVEATRRGDPELIVSIQAQVFARLHGLFPGLTADLLSLVNRALPGPGGIGAATAEGVESETAVSESFLTALGQRAAAELNQTPAPTPS